MDNDLLANELQAVVAQLDAVRRSLMADEPRRRTYLQAVKAQRDAENLLDRVDGEKRFYRFAAE